MAGSHFFWLLLNFIDTWPRVLIRSKLNLNSLMTRSVHAWAMINAKSSWKVNNESNLNQSLPLDKSRLNII